MRRARMDNDVCGEITGSRNRRRHSTCGVRRRAEEHSALIAYRRLNMLTAHLHLPLLFAVSFLSPSPSFAQLNVITSVGFAGAYSCDKALRVARQWTRYHCGTTSRRGARGRRHHEQGRAWRTRCRRQNHPSKRGGPGAGSTWCSRPRWRSQTGHQHRGSIAAPAASRKMDPMKSR
jgi:hypothetical protein